MTCAPRATFGVDLGTRRAAVVSIDVGFVWSASLEKPSERKLFPSEIDAGAALGISARQALAQAGVHPEQLYVYWYFERPVIYRNVMTAVGQALSAGAFFSQLPGQSVQIYPSSVWKKEVVGDGTASKDDTRAWVELTYPALAKACQGVEDCYDAVAICEYGRRMADLG